MPAGTTASGVVVPATACSAACTDAVAADGDHGAGAGGDRLGGLPLGLRAGGGGQHRRVEPAGPESVEDGIGQDAGPGRDRRRG